jgi:quercetin dioxygenase-like cupin family protein
MQEATMTLRLAESSSSLIGVLGVVLLFQGPVAAQYSHESLAQRYGSGWENDQLRVRTIAVEPGAQMPAQADADRVLVFLTADLQGRSPAAEAVWQPAGAQELENRGSRRVEAVLIELKHVSASTFGITPPEALPATGAVDARILIDNPRVTVTRQRYFPGTYAAEAWHFHPQDAVVVYLRGGYTWPPTLDWGAYRVRRGEVDVVPANTVHTFSNAGSDPLEFVVIFPK